MATGPQQGILNHPPDHALYIAVDYTGDDPTVNRQATERLRDVVHLELRSQLDETTPDSPKDQPSAETGELGFDSGYDRYHLTITVGFAATAYAKLGVTTGLPADLRPIDWTQLGDDPYVKGQTDLMIQVCTDSVYLAEHVVRRITSDLADVLTVRWVLPGSQRHTSRAGRVNRDEGRALIGFLDGTSNLHPRTSQTDRRLVFVDPADRGDLPPQTPVIPPNTNPYTGGTDGPKFPDLHPVPGAEPEWTKHGTYMVMRASLINMPTWDARTIDDQEKTIGRRKVTGNPLGVSPDRPQNPIPEPDFPGRDANTDIDAHIRKANPRGPGDDLRRIFRRGYPLILPSTDGLKLGLAFVCFARTITTQFEFITRAWTTNPDFPHPGAGVDHFRSAESLILGGGYYFVPALARVAQPWSWVVPPVE